MVKITKEKLNPELYSALLPLAQKCWEESTQNKGASCAYVGERDFKIEPNNEEYQKLSDNGLLALITVRDEDKLVGYALGFVYRALHHKKVLGAICDTVYIEPKYRSYAGPVIQRFEQEIKDLGAEIIGWPTHINGPIYKLLVALGYVGDDIVMEKRLCV